MKPATMTPESQKSTTSRGRSGRESYFPECQKSINCNCEMCVASKMATQDLVSSQSTLRQSSVSKTSTTPKQTRSPPSPDATNPTTPKTRRGRRETTSTLVSPPLRSTAKSMPVAKKAVGGEDEERKERTGFGWSSLIWVLGVLMVLALDLSVPVAVERVAGGTKMSGEVVKSIGEELKGKGDLKEMLGSLEERLEEVSGENMSSCSSDDSVWALNQDGNLLHMKCVLYKSMLEEVSVWGFPLQSSGLFLTGLSPRSITVLSGKLNKWPEGKVRFSTIERGASWVSSSRSALAVQLAANTWVLEHRRSSLLHNSRLVPLVWEFLKNRGSHIAKELMRFEWLLLHSPSVFSTGHFDEGKAMPPT